MPIEEIAGAVIEVVAEVASGVVVDEPQPRRRKSILYRVFYWSMVLLLFGLSGLALYSAFA